jgi:hypothetical protein
VTFPAASKTGPCNECLDNETQDAYTEDELLAEFPYAERSGDGWLPKVHPNCVCKMFPYLKDGELPTVPKHLSDSEFDDWLTALLSAGYITAAIYDAVVARRKKKKENKQ